MPLAFLDKGQNYVAHLYLDDPAVPTRTHVKIERFLADRNTVLKMAVGVGGGAAVRISPANVADHYPIYTSERAR